MIELRRASIGPAQHSLQRLSANTLQASTETLAAATAAADTVADGSVSSGNGSPPPINLGYICAAAGDHVDITLMFSTTVGAPEQERARIVVKTLSGNKKQKLESFVMSDQALGVLMEILRSAAPDLHRVAARFLVDPALK